MGEEDRFRKLGYIRVTFPQMLLSSRVINSLGCEIPKTSYEAYWDLNRELWVVDSEFDQDIEGNTLNECIDVLTDALNSDETISVIGEAEIEEIQVNMKDEESYRALGSARVKFPNMIASEEVPREYEFLYNRDIPIWGMPYKRLGTMAFGMSLDECIKSFVIDHLSEDPAVDEIGEYEIVY